MQFRAYTRLLFATFCSICPILFSGISIQLPASVNASSSSSLPTTDLHPVHVQYRQFDENNRLSAAWSRLSYHRKVAADRWIWLGMDRFSAKESQFG
jgi:hypothetical protein